MLKIKVNLKKMKSQNKKLLIQILKKNKNKVNDKNMLVRLIIILNKFYILYKYSLIKILI